MDENVRNAGAAEKRIFFLMAKLTKNSKLLIAIGVIQSIVELFLSTFLAAYFFNLTNNNVVPASVFNIIVWLTLMLGFLVIGRWVKSKHKILIYRIGFVVDALLLILIFVLKERIIYHIWILGIVSGIAKAFFNSPNNLLRSELITKDEMVKFSGYLSAVSSVFSIFMPLVFGWFIQVDSFANVAIFILILSLTQIILAHFFEKIKNSPKPYNFRRICLLTLKSREVKYTLAMQFLFGVAVDSMNLLIILYVLYMFKTTLNLGIFISVFAVVGIIKDYCFGKWGSYKDFSWLLPVCGIITAAAAAYFAFDATKISFIIFKFALVIAAGFISQISEINMLMVAQHKPISPNYHAEYLTLREGVLNLGRLVGLDIIILVALSGSQALLKYLILAFSILIAFIGYMNIKLNNKVNLPKKQITAHKT